MNVALIGTRTGYGHISVLNAIKSRLSKANLNLFVETAFPEEKLSGYDFLCDFYNYLLGTSLELSNKFTEMLVFSRSDKSEKFIESSKEAIIQYLETNNIDIIVSFAPYLNNALCHAIKSIRRKIIITTVLTDPFIPYMVGFDCPFFDYYYVANNMVKSDLVSKGIDKRKILNYGFPVSESYFSIYTKNEISYFKNSLGLDARKTIICNCGAEGNPLFLKYIKSILSLHEYTQCIFICGKNTFLRKSVEKMTINANNNNIITTGFIDYMPMLLYISDLIITKPGANIVFESLHSKVPVCIDTSAGILYQEKGIVDFITSKELGIIIKQNNQVESNLFNILSNSSLLEKYKQNISNLGLIDSGNKIANHIITL